MLTVIIDTVIDAFIAGAGNKKLRDSAKPGEDEQVEREFQVVMAALLGLFALIVIGVLLCAWLFSALPVWAAVLLFGLGGPATIVFGAVTFHRHAKRHLAQRRTDTEQDTAPSPVA